MSDTSLPADWSWLLALSAALTQLQDALFTVNQALGEMAVVGGLTYIGKSGPLFSFVRGMPSGVMHTNAISLVLGLHRLAPI
jgi:hypothetical protein